jgi:hypothetical protein
MKSSKGIAFGPTLWKVRGRGLVLIGREEGESKKGPIGIEYMFLLYACVNNDVPPLSRRCKSHRHARLS